MIHEHMSGGTVINVKFARKTASLTLALASVWAWVLLAVVSAFLSV